jgi:formylglycine-generating enzyme required for sulfatase activity
MAKLLPVQLQKDQLLTDLLNGKITLIAFFRAWDKVATKSTTKKPVESTKSITEEPAEPTKIDKLVNAVKTLLKGKISLITGSLVLVLSLVAGWKFIPRDVPTPTIITTKPLVNQASVNEKPTAPSVAIAKLESDMVAVKGGCFKMGSPETEIDRDNDEIQHTVCVDDFSIGKYEVTQAQWQAVMGDNPSEIEGNNLPVESVSYNEVQDFINELNRQTGKIYRLPTEAEWEFVARAGTTTAFYTGDCINTEQANYKGLFHYNNCSATSVYKEKTVDVGSYSPNPWGLYDMAGNVREWTSSAYIDDGSPLQ